MQRAEDNRGHHEDRAECPESDTGQETKTDKKGNDLQSIKCSSLTQGDVGSKEHCKGVS